MSDGSQGGGGSEGWGEGWGGKKGGGGEAGDGEFGGGGCQQSPHVFMHPFWKTLLLSHFHSHLGVTFEEQ